MKKKPNYNDAIVQILCGKPVAPVAGNLYIVPAEAAEVAVEALERLRKQPAMKDHERIFFALCYNLRHTHKARDVVNLLADTIPHKRCWYYLEKWHRLGFYSSGVSADLGWLYPEKLPQRYREIVQEEIARPAHIPPAQIFRDTTDPSALLAAGRKALEDFARERRRVFMGELEE